MFEYYHFLIDFAPMFLASIHGLGRADLSQHATSECTEIYANGVKMPMQFGQVDQSKDGGYHILEKWNFLFGTPLNMTYTYLQGQANALSQRFALSECPEIAWDHWGEWAAQPAKNFQDLRAWAFARAGLSTTATQMAY